MKKLRFLLSSSAEKVKSNGITIANGIKKTNSKPKTYKFRFALNNSIFSHRQWFMGEIKWLRRATRKDFLYNGSFQEAIGSVLAIAQCFGLMPVVGIKSKTVSKLHFKWKCFRTIYSIMLFILMSIYASITLLITLKNDIALDKMNTLIFYSSAFYGMICFGVLALKWPKVMQRWESVEQKLPKYRTQRQKRKMATHIKMLSFVVLICSLVEHTLSMVSTVHYLKNCLHQTDPFEPLMWTPLFKLLPYSPWIAFVGKYVNVSATFCWNYMDLFVMIVSIGLSSQFKKINRDLKRIKGEHMTEEYWALRRLQYRKLCALCKVVDDAVSHLILLSFSNNLFFICDTLLKSIRPMRSIPHAVYFWFSLIFLISRTLAVSLYSAEIHDESKKPMEILRAVPTQSYCTEVQRFSEHVINDTVALSGMRFFFLTRKLILSMIATIITYELVLIQFHKEEPVSEICRER